MKEGLVHISKRTGELRYSTSNKATNNNHNNDAEQWIHQLSIYYAAEDIKRGQPVSPSLVSDLTPSQRESAVPFVSLTNTAKHKKCLGLAMEPAKAGEPLHILSTGRFVYDSITFNKVIDATNFDNEEEYYPTFGYDISSNNKSQMYQSLIGLPVFVKSRNAINFTDGQPSTIVTGELTVDEKEVYYGNHNIIQVGFIADAPNSSADTELSIEIQLEGDGRGPIDNTQWEYKLGEQITVQSSEQLKVLAVGQDEGEGFECLISCTAPALDIDRVIEPSDFIAIQKLDGKTKFITFNNPSATIESLKSAILHKNNTEDMAFFNIAENYARSFQINSSQADIEHLLEVQNIDFNCDATSTAYDSNISNIETALKQAYAEISVNPNLSINSLSARQSSVAHVLGDDNTVLSAYKELYTNNKEGYFELYVSEHLANTFLNGTTLISGGSSPNKGKAVLADIRLASRQEIAGLYFNHEYDTPLVIDSDIIVLHQGQFTIDTSVANYPELVPGAVYYLGTHGNLVTTPIEWTDSVVKIGVAKDTHTLMVDCGDCRIYDVGTLPVGYMKPSVKGNAEYGFLLMDGGESDVSSTIQSITYANGTDVVLKNRYEVAKYPIFYERLKAIYSEEALNYIEDPLTYTYTNGTTEEISGTFIIPKAYVTVEGVSEYAQIKWLEEGTFAQIPRIPYIRTMGNLSDDTNHICTFDPIDITKLVHYGPRENSIYNVELEDLDIHLYINLNTNVENSYPDWVEVPEGFKIFNNTSTYGFRWKIEPYNEEGNDESYENHILNSQVKFKLTPCLSQIVDGNEITSRGIAYQMNPFQPPKLMFDYQYKVFIARHEYNNRKVDLDAMFTNSIANRVISPLTGEPTKDPVSGKAVFDFMNTRSDVLNFNVNSNLNIGKVTSPAKLEAYLDNTSKIHGPLEFLGLSGSSIVKIENGNISLSNGKTYNNWAAFTADTDRTNVVTVGILQDLFKKDWNTIPILGVTNNGYNGGINADKLDGLRLGARVSDRITENANPETSYIPYVQNKKLRIADEIVYAAGNPAVSTNATAEVAEKVEVNNNGQIVKTITGAGKTLIEKIGRAPDTNIDVEFLTGDNTYATIKAGNIDFTSSIEFKNLYNSQIRTYKTEFDPSLVKDSFETVDVSGEDTGGRLDSALQAAYELPINVFSYKQDPSWCKRYIGLIIEQLNHITSANGLTSDVERNITNIENYGGEAHTNADIFNYTEDEITSIDTFIKMLTDDAEKGVNIYSSVGMLFAAAKETQERLLKLEASTFGRDAETIPGEKASITEEIELGLPEKEISQTPTYIGLNRIVRALCKEVFNTYDPQNAYNLSPTFGSYRARIEDIYKQIEGDNGGQNDLDNYKKGNVLNPLNNSSEWYTQSGYYAGTEEENIDDNERPAVEQAKQTNTYPTDIKLEPVSNFNVEIPNDIDDQGAFNGLNDAMNRVVQKLNALTAEVNGADNIKAGPTNLNIIRESVKKVICDLYFNQDNIDSHNQFKGADNDSKMKLIEELLFKNNKVNNSIVTDTYKDYPYNTLPINTQEFKTYNNVIDLIIATLGEEIVPLANIGEASRLPEEKRLYLSVAKRLKDLESAMDYSLGNILGNIYDGSYENLPSVSYPVSLFITELSNLLGLSYIAETGEWVYQAVESNSTYSNLQNHTNMYSVISDIYSRVLSLENTTHKLIDTILPGHYNRNQNISKDVDSLLETVYGTNQPASYNNNIVDSLISVLYGTRPNNNSHQDLSTSTLDTAVIPVDYNFAASTAPQGRYKYLGIEYDSFEAALEQAWANNDTDPVLYKIEN